MKPSIYFLSHTNVEKKILKLLYQDYGLIIKDLEKYYNNKMRVF